MSGCQAILTLAVSELQPSAEQVLCKASRVSDRVPDGRATQPPPKTDHPLAHLPQSNLAPAQKPRRGSMSASQVQAWIAVVGGLLAVLVGLRGFFNYRSKRDTLAAVGAAFSSTVDSLSDENLTKQIAAAVLLRRFFDPHTEQGTRRLAYKSEAVNVIAGMLREDHDPRLQKALADGLRYAKVLCNVDLQECNLANAYLGQKRGDDWTLDLSDADLYDAKLDGASLKRVTAQTAIFYLASLKKTVFERADLVNADFRDADLSGAKFPRAVLTQSDFRGATLTDATFAGAFLSGADFRRAELSGARFDGANIDRCEFTDAEHIPPEVAQLLDDRLIAGLGVTVPTAESRA